MCVSSVDLANFVMLILDCNDSSLVGRSLNEDARQLFVKSCDGPIAVTADTDDPPWKLKQKMF